MKWFPLTLLLCLLSYPAVGGDLKPLPAEAAPALDLPLLGGHRVALSSLKGRVVLVNFWASWCPPCRKEMPSMERLKKDLADRPFSILAVNAGEVPDQIAEFLREVSVTFPIALDQEGRAVKAWQAFVFPTSYLVDKAGRVRFGLIGSIEWDDPATKAVIQKLLEEPTKTTAGGS
jgi:thiol-disulfide isomerase/thioredoxin